jgi:hypothetical protein
MSLKYEIKNDKHLFYKFVKTYKLLKNQNHCMIRAYLMLSKVNQWRLSVYKYLYLEKFLSTSTEVIGRRRRKLTDVLIFVVSKILRKNNKI